jgi:hypothetical protein
MFHIGQKVVCVNDIVKFPLGSKRTGHDGTVWTSTGNMGGLRAGAVYTIRGFSLCPVDNAPTVLLEEIMREEIMRYGVSQGEAGYCISRFRPVIEKKTDISIFTRILDDVSKRETVNAK